MAFNLITTPWLEVRRASGSRSIVRPSDITDDFDADPILALDFPRPDWNAALTEFLIGLTFLALAPEDSEDWGESFRQPPTQAALQNAFAPFARAFDLDGDGPRAFQDFDPLTTADLKPLSGLLIDAPGENTLKNNADLFVKRGGSQTLSPAHAAAALITLQTYAPSGGAGHRTSMRGGGPLTTLLTPSRKSRGEVSTLWDRVWANVPDRSATVETVELAGVFPWLAPTITSEKGQMVTAEDRHPALAFFACPRRIRLEFDTDALVTGYRTLNYGANYLHWLHPLSPYRDDKTSGKLPLHPNAGASDYGDWLAWWGFNGAPALPLVLWKERRAEVHDVLAKKGGIEAFGYDMDNMKARQWLDARFPWVAVHDQAHGALKTTLSELIGGADAAARAVRFAAKVALFGQAKDSGYRLPDNLSMDALKEPGERLWSETQTPFEDLLREIASLLNDGPQPTTGHKEAWLKTLRGRALRIFDETVDFDGMSAANPRRLLYARDQLAFAFADHPKAAVRKALNLTATVKPPKTKEPA